MQDSPYSKLPPSAFWRTGVAERSPLKPTGIYRRKFEIDRRALVGTAGSCFAQHISRYLTRSGFTVIDAEPPPSHLAPGRHGAYGYSMYSARYGNIYTMRQLLQLAQEAFGLRKPGEIVWRRGERFHDALRPNVEPDGLESPEEVLEHRRHHLARVRDLLESVDVFVFTLGLTEAWVHVPSGTVLPTVPGSIAGSFDPKTYEFKNFRFSEIIADFNEFKKLVHGRQHAGHRTKFLLTVSPVPLTATASGQHVLMATTYSKSVLRAVAGQLAENQADVDYFPSFEIINNCWSRGIFYETNMRSVSPAGVEIVMEEFLREHAGTGGPAAAAAAEPTEAPATRLADDAAEDPVCEEALLEAFRK